VLGQLVFEEYDDNCLYYEYNSTFEVLQIRSCQALVNRKISVMLFELKYQNDGIGMPLIGGLARISISMSENTPPKLAISEVSF